jgi:hypothetical protein
MFLEGRKKSLHQESKTRSSSLHPSILVSHQMVSVIKRWGKGWVGNMTSMEDRKAYRGFVGKIKDKAPFTRPKRQ